MMKAILTDFLKTAYPDDLEFLDKEIKILLRKYQKLIKPESPVLSHKDSILITYADAVYEEGEMPLTTLKHFFDTFLKGYVSAIHLLPCFPFTSDDGFSVVDYYQINPEYGDWDAITTLHKSADIMFDAVVNHTSKSSEWFKKFQENIHPYNDYFIEADPQEDFSKVVRPRALPLLHSYKKQGQEVFLWTTFSEDQLDLNFKNPYVFLQVLDILLFYISKGGRYIRLDAIAFLWKANNTSCIHLPETHNIIKAYRYIIESIAPHAVIVTETNVPHSENISYFGNGEDEAHMVYNFTLPPLLAYSVHKQDIRVFVKWAQALEFDNKPTCFFNFTASHDGIGVRPLQGIIPDEEIAFLAQKSKDHGGFVSFKTNEDGTKSPYELNCNYFELLSHPSESEDRRIKKFMLTQAIMLTMPGVPGIYYHSILGSLNFIEGVKSSGINRRINREKLEYKKLMSALEDKGSLRFKVYQSYIELLAIRKEQPVFNPYGKATFSIVDEVLQISREYEGEKLVALFNVKQTPINVNIDCKIAYDLLTGKELNEAKITINPWGYKWIKCN